MGRIVLVVVGSDEGDGDGDGFAAVEGGSREYYCLTRRRFGLSSIHRVLLLLWF